MHTKYLNVTVKSPEESLEIKILSGSIIGGKIDIDKVIKDPNLPQGKAVVYASSYELGEVKKNNLEVLTGKEVFWLTK